MVRARRDGEVVVNRRGAGAGQTQHLPIEDPVGAGQPELCRIAHLQTVVVALRDAGGDDDRGAIEQTQQVLSLARVLVVAQRRLPHQPVHRRGQEGVAELRHPLAFERDLLADLRQALGALLKFGGQFAKTQFQFLGPLAGIGRVVVGVAEERAVGSRLQFGAQNIQAGRGRADVQAVHLMRRLRLVQHRHRLDPVNPQLLRALQGGGGFGRLRLGAGQQSLLFVDPGLQLTDAPVAVRFGAFAQRGRARRHAGNLCLDAPDVGVERAGHAFQIEQTGIVGANVRQIAERLSALDPFTDSPRLQRKLTIDRCTHHGDPRINDRIGTDDRNTFRKDDVAGHPGDREARGELEELVHDGGCL
ncbi:protein of unknown function (plasmid) [Azospirillum baldaniorum]|uniref:Uncharacterized protein n=1 Tax=Azospirillum baldaniorum TaxID=1064539 RepID=A0A9P1NQR3_9PROT|nr:protein of unknown function [Azospirillum baldaniorum]